jgi:rhodanese-related sulfurtransferase
MKSDRMQARLLNGILALLVGLTFFAAFASAQDAKPMTGPEMVAAANKVITTVTIAQAKQELSNKGVVFIDVREAEEVAKGRTPGAVTIPRGLLEFQIGNQVPDKATRIVVYCQVGGRGALATETLKRMGYTNAVNMGGGWGEWLKAGYPAQ